MFSLEVHVMEPSDLERVHLVKALNQIFLLINYFLQVFQMVKWATYKYRRQSVVNVQYFFSDLWLWVNSECPWYTMENKLYMNDFTFEIKLIRP